ncbi:MAG: JAB domain-containing protein [Lachnospiraceae bacterium]|nr:JAB domain-containing protein [Lachnospiraceae bacterium]
MSAVIQLVKDADGFMRLKRIQTIAPQFANVTGSYLSYRDIVEMVDGVFDISSQATEFMYVVGFDMRMHVMGMMELAHGSEFEVKFEMRELFAALMLMRASRFVLLHNHVHGVTLPSNADQLRTVQVKQAADLMGFQFLNHIVVGENDFTLIMED